MNNIIYKEYVNEYYNIQRSNRVITNETETAEEHTNRIQLEATRASDEANDQLTKILKNVEIKVRRLRGLSSMIWRGEICSNISQVAHVHCWMRISFKSSF